MFFLSELDMKDHNVLLPSYRAQPRRVRFIQPTRKETAAFLYLPHNAPNAPKLTFDLPLVGNTEATPN